MVISKPDWSEIGYGWGWLCLQFVFTIAGSHQEEFSLAAVLCLCLLALVGGRTTTVHSRAAFTSVPNLTHLWPHLSLPLSRSLHFCSRADNSKQERRWQPFDCRSAILHCVNRVCFPPLFFPLRLSHQLPDLMWPQTEAAAAATTSGTSGGWWLVGEGKHSISRSQS